MYFPLFINLEKKNILIVGGGSIALRRARALAPYCGSIKVVALCICEGIKALGVITEKREFEKEDIKGMFLVLAATDNSELNEKIGGLCREAGILVNVCSNRESCDFYFPALIESSDFTCGLVSKSGDRHKDVKNQAQRIRELLSHKNQ